MSIIVSAYFKIPSKAPYEFYIPHVTRFLKLVQTKMKNKTGRGRKPMVFTDEDVKGFAELLTKKDGFSRKDILSTISLNLSPE